MTREACMPELPASDDTSRQRALRQDVLLVIDEATGLTIDTADSSVPFVELGFDSLSLTQMAIEIRQRYKVELTFRQLMENLRTLDSLIEFLVDSMSGEISAVVDANDDGLASGIAAQLPGKVAVASAQLVEQVIHQQMEMMAQQLALLTGVHSGVPGGMQSSALPPVPALQESADNQASDGLSEPDSKAAFGAIAKIRTDVGDGITEGQRLRLDAFMRRYIARTRRSKEFTQAQRSRLADPRVVSGFTPIRKEITYQIVIERSQGSRLWDLDGNEYVDALNGFGMSLFGWQPEFVVDAIQKQIAHGYEIGPQHPLAGEVAELLCEVTGFDRVGLCNTGSEAVMGAMRIARTVTGRKTIVIFTDSYHGIFDEVVVRAAKGGRALPAAPGIMPGSASNILVLDYGTRESLQVIKARGHELAAVLVEPVQSRRPDFQPRDFLRELREVTQDVSAVLIFDEVVTGFRCHPGGIQALFGISADLCTYGKVVGGGFPIGVIAGKREFMDALDGGAWQYGDDSMPTVGVTYFAGTFVRHPLALAAAKATLEHLKQRGPELQVALTRSATEMVDSLNAFCHQVGAPIQVVSFASMWRIRFAEEHALQDLLFAMMRMRGVHILDNFPCFLTTAHSASDIERIVEAFQESVTELQDGGFLPRRREATVAVLDTANPPVPGALIGKDPEGNPAWFVPNPDKTGKFLRLDG